jgi:hypothetical protein
MTGLHAYAGHLNQGLVLERNGILLAHLTLYSNQIKSRQNFKHVCSAALSALLQKIAARSGVYAAA